MKIQLKIKWFYWALAGYLVIVAFMILSSWTGVGTAQAQLPGGGSTDNDVLFKICGGDPNYNLDDCDQTVMQMMFEAARNSAEELQVGVIKSAYTGDPPISGRGYHN